MCKAGGASSENPLGITTNPRRSDNFFLIIGDWGRVGESRGCQVQIAQMMKDYVAKQQAQGKKCLFVGSVGDNFYAKGVHADGDWQVKWSNVYGTNAPGTPLFNVPWFSVLGNHDLGGDDPGCACGRGCKQFNGRRPGGTDKWWMPDYNWHYYIPGVELEVVGLDTNAIDLDGLGGDGCANGAFEMCRLCGDSFRGFLQGEKAKGEKLLDQRAAQTAAKTVLIMQHYNDENIGALYKTRFESKNGRKAKVLSAYGHAHDQICEGSRDNGCDVILTGGGGGWQGGTWFGFTAVHLTDDGGFQTILETDEVRIRQNSCVFVDAASQSTTGDRSSNRSSVEFV